ncbi:MAG: hypothetical protein K6F09_07085 [Clostridiales bacterium]|nr:hypothetical protein [Clostridiales bacterium]
MLISELPAVMARCLVVTILSEGVLAFLLGVRSPKGQSVVLLSNVMTNPLAVSLNVLFTFLYGRFGYWCSLLFLEAAVFFAEAAVYRSHKPCKRNPFILSAVLNGSSFLIGIIWNNII